MREEGFQLAYEEAGSGIPLILLHGNGEDRSYFRHQIKDLQDIRHVYALDTRGHGQSPRGTAPFNLDQFARDLEEFMDQNGIKQADLLGFSDGANIALLFALKHPDRVTKLILA
ncbi:alpha/beta fold hydrolase, partial [Faecalibaculum rodentium]